MVKGCMHDIALEGKVMKIFVGGGWRNMVFRPTYTLCMYCRVGSASNFLYFGLINEEALVAEDGLPILILAPYRRHYNYLTLF
jgi:hypothetical protein